MSASNVTPLAIITDKIRNDTTTIIEMILSEGMDSFSPKKISAVNNELKIIWDTWINYVVTIANHNVIDNSVSKASETLEKLKYDNIKDLQAQDLLDQINEELKHQENILNLMQIEFSKKYQKLEMEEGKKTEEALLNDLDSQSKKIDQQKKSINALKLGLKELNTCLKIIHSMQNDKSADKKNINNNIFELAAAFISGMIGALVYSGYKLVSSPIYAFKNFKKKSSSKSTKSEPDISVPLSVAIGAMITSIKNVFTEGYTKGTNYRNKLRLINSISTLEAITRNDNNYPSTFYCYYTFFKNLNKKADKIPTKTNNKKTASI